MTEHHIEQTVPDSEKPKPCAVGWRVIVVTTVLFGIGFGFLSSLGAVHTTPDGDYAADGWIYGAIAENPARALKFTNYHYRRQLPSLLVHYGLRAIGLPLNRQNVTHGFRFLNWVMMTAAVASWFVCSRSWHFNDVTALLGFVALFINAITLYLLPYMPVMTDAAAYAFAIMQLAAWSTSSYWMLLLTTLMGASTHPLLFPTGVLLLLFPRRFVPNECRQFALRSYTTSYCVSSLICACVAAALYCIVATRAFNRRWIAADVPAVNEHIQRFLLIVGLIIGAVYVFVTARAAIRSGMALVITHGRQLLATTNLKAVLMVSGLVVLMAPSRQNTPGFVLGDILGQIRVRIHSAPASDSDDFAQYEPRAALAWHGMIWKSALYSLASKKTNLPLPGLFLVAHAMYFGPLWAIAIANTAGLFRLASRFGAGVFLIVAIASSIWLMSESRCVHPVYPAVALVLCALFAFSQRSQYEWKAVLLPIAVWHCIYSLVWLYLAVSFEQTRAFAQIVPFASAGLRTVPSHFVFTVMFVAPGCFVTYRLTRQWINNGGGLADERVNSGGTASECG